MTPPILRAAAIAAATLLASTPGVTLAQSSTNGQTLYNQVLVAGRNSCAASACHGSNPSRRLNRIQNGAAAATIRSAVSSVGDMQFLAGRLTDAQYNDLAAYIASATGATPSYLAVATAPQATLSATSIAFGSVTVGNTSALRTATLTSSGTAALAVTSLASTNPAFTLTHDCPASLPVSSHCTLTLSFTPAAATAYSGNVALVSGAGTSSIALNGTGVAAPVGLLGWSGAPTALSFTATVGTPSAAQTLTLQNAGSAATTLATVALTGADAAEFVLGGTCGAGTSLPVNASCTVTVAFDPGVAGAHAATLQVTASNAGNPAAVALIGTAAAAAGGASSGGASSGGAATPAASAGVNANEGAGGCSIARPGTRLDPLLPLLAAAALAVLLRRRRTRGNR